MLLLRLFIVVAVLIGSSLPRQAPSPSGTRREGQLQSTAASEALNPSVSTIESQVVDAVGRATRGVLGSKHDFSLMTGRAVDACGACHVPHVQAAEPREKDAEPFSLAFYRMAGQREVLVPDRFMPGPTSLICLSCHNGAVASSTVSSSHVLLSAHRSGFDIGGFTIRDHPIGVEYPAHQKGYVSRSRIIASGKIPLPDNRMECVSCHDPHNVAGVEHLLVMSNQRSALCLSCHEK